MPRSYTSRGPETEVRRRIEAVRRALGLTQAEIASRLFGVAPTTLRRYLSPEAASSHLSIPDFADRMLELLEFLIKSGEQKKIIEFAKKTIDK